MEQGFTSDTQVSQPINSDKYRLDANMNGFGWDTDKGIFIPVSDELSYFQDPYPKSEITVIPNVG